MVSDILPDQNIMYKALVNKDSSFEGIFIVGVKTTGIFCRPTCPARKPKPDHILFFTGVKSALDHGFRPCKRCKPDGLSLDQQHAETVAEACRLIETAEGAPTLTGALPPRPQRVSPE